jgi:hypothetical protein
MKTLLTLLGFTLLIATSAYAQDGMPVTASPALQAAVASGLPKRDLTLQLLDVQLTDKNVILGCRINFRALVEVNVYDLDTVSVLAISELLEPGVHRLPLKRENLLPGYQYLYSFYYKGKKYFGRFKN